VSLMKRGNVYWSYLNMDGIRYSRSTGTTNFRQATQIELRFREQLNLTRLQIIEPHPEMPFGALAARFLAEGARRPWHVDRLNRLLPYWSEVAIGRISKPMSFDYRRRRHAEKAVTDTTINRDLQALRRILFWAVDEGLLPSNPLGRLRLVQERRKPRSILALDDEERLLAAAAPHLRQLIVAALDTGMRRGELLHQLWEHVDFNRKLLSVTQSKTAGGEGREIPFTNRTYELLLAERKQEGFLFTFKGKPIGTIKTAWKAAVRRAEIRYLRFHDLRHTFNTRLMESGVIQDVRKVLMGHSVGEDINSTYTHVELPAKREAIRKLEVWVTTQTQHQPQAQGGPDERTESRRTNPSKVLSFRRRKEAVEKEDTGRGRA
jgi:integrase